MKNSINNTKLKVWKTSPIHLISTLSIQIMLYNVIMLSIDKLELGYLEEEKGEEIKQLSFEVFN